MDTYDLTGESADTVINEVLTNWPEQNKGAIPYRKFVWVLKYLKKESEELIKYRQEIVSKIDDRIQKKNKNIEDIQNVIKSRVLSDPSIKDTKAGGKKVVMPDIGTVSISKEQMKIEIVNPDLVMEKLGKEFTKIKTQLDTTKVKNYIIETKKIIDGTKVTKERRLTIR